MMFGVFILEMMFWQFFLKESIKMITKIFFFLFFAMLYTYSQEKIAVENLVELLKTGTDSEKLEAVQQLEELKKKALPAMNELIESLAIEKNTKLQSAIVSAIMQIDNSIIPSLISALKRRQNFVRLAPDVSGNTFHSQASETLNVLGYSADFPESPLAYQKRHALLIGINKYDNAPLLSGPNFDAAEVAYVLASRYGFEEVTLVVDTIPDMVFPKNVHIEHLEKVQLIVILQKLEELAKKTGKKDALLFFYAGHGIKNYLFPADANPKNHNTSLPLLELVQKIRNCDAHHSLIILDCCFSGSLLDQIHEAHRIVGILGEAENIGHEGDNLSRVFQQRSFQVITSGTGKEAVADQLLESQRYSTPIAQGHSPFTTVLLQALQGLTGRPDGRQLASDLGYYLNFSLVNEMKDVRQVPRYSSLGLGDGDFIFFPAYKVLNPKLIAPLYLSGKAYSELRESACYALQKFITEQPREVQTDLTRSSIAHIAQLLYEDNSD